MRAAGTKKTLLSNSISIFIVRLFPTIGTLLVVLYFSKRMDLAAYGRYQDFWVQFYIFSAIAMAGLPTFAVTYRIAQLVQLFRSLKQRTWLIYSCALVLLGVIFSILQFRQGELNYWLPASFLILSVAYSVMETLLSVGRKFMVISLISFAYLAVFLWLHYHFIHSNESLNWLFQSLVILSAVRLTIALPYFMKQYSSWKKETTSDDHLKDGYQLWLHIGLYDISQMVFKWADKFIVSLFLAKEVLALYYNGSLEIPFLPVLLGAAGSAMLMQMSDTSGDTAADKLAILKRSSQVLSSIVFPLFFFLFFFAKPLFATFLSEKYVVAIPIFWVTLMVVPLRAYNFITLLQHYKKGWLINAGALLDIVVALSLAYPFYKLWDTPGLALAFVLSSYVQAGFYLWHTAKVTGLGLLELLPLGNWIIKLIVFSILFIAAYYLSFGFSSMISVLILGASVMLAAMAVSLLIDNKRLKAHV